MKISEVLLLLFMTYIGKWHFSQLLNMSQTSEAPEFWLSWERSRRLIGIKTFSRVLEMITVNIFIRLYSFISTCTHIT